MDDILSNETSFIANTPDNEFCCTIGDANFSVLLLRYPLKQAFVSEGIKPRHKHNYLEVVFFEEDGCTFESATTTLPLKEKEWVIVSPLCEHKFYNAENQHCFKLGFSFYKKHDSSEHTFSTFSQVFDKLTFYHQTKDSKMSSLIADLFSCVNKQCEKFRLQACFANILFYLFDTLSEHFSLKTENKHEMIASRNVADVITNALLFYYTTDISIEKLAKIIYLCPRQVNRICNKLYGRTFYGQKNFFRIENAKKLLVQTSKTVLEISLECGYNSLGSFYAAFAKEESLSPKQYRLSHV